MKFVALLSAATTSRKILIGVGTFFLVASALVFYYFSANILQPSYYTSNGVQISDKSFYPTFQHPYDERKLAFLVETRPLPHLPALFAHMTNLVPPEWRFRFMGSPEAIEYMRSSPFIARLEAAGKIIITAIPGNYSVAGRQEISQMFTDPYLYTHHLAPAEHLLVFQPDSIICAKSPKTVNDFLEWDYIGAPWGPESKFGGNGGLSLRRVSRILMVLERERREMGHIQMEDEWLSNRLVGLEGARMANASVSKTFSVEANVWDESPMGYHVGWMGVHHGQLWDDEEKVHHIMEYCPEVKMILGMKLVGDKPVGVGRRGLELDLYESKI
ncbi:hypothetical protein DL95DRAFT_343646 [Leptodontidium sp. 2 PMI_412]|nr:hypothetical protein DL95DRAFT_343646 [Leptodontidium sp. 2 PMI_412]